METCHRDETDLVVTVVVGVTVAVADGRIDPAAGGVALVEDVVEVHLHDGFLDYFLGLQRVAEADIGGAVGRQRTVEVLGVVEIHARDVVRVPGGLEALVVEGDEAVQDGRRREGQGGVVVVDDIVAVTIVGLAVGIGVAFPVVPVLHDLVEVLDLVLAQGGVGLDGQPFGGAHASLQLNAHAVRVLDIGGEGFADVADGTGLYKLVVVVHIVEVGASLEDASVVVVAQLIVEELLWLGEGIGAVVGEVVTLGLAVAHGHGGVDVVAVRVEGDAALGVEEGVLLVDVEFLVVVATLVVIELVVDAVGLVVHIAELHVAEDGPMVGKSVGRLDEDIAVELLCIGVVIFVVAIGEVFVSHALVGDIGHIAEVVALEVLGRDAADDVPVCILVTGEPHEAVGVLAESFLADEVGLFHLIAFSVIIGHAKLREFVVRTELLVVAVAVGVVQRGRGRPMLVDLPSGGEEVVVLPEVVGGAVPEGAVVHLVALGHVMAVLVLDEVAVLVGDEVFVERVELSQTHLIHIGVGLDACVLTIGAVHKAEVVVASRHAVPGLAGHLEITDVLVAEDEVLAHPGEAAVVAAAAALGAVDEAVGVGLVVGSVDDEVVPQHACGGLGTEVERVERAVGARDLGTRHEGRLGRCQGYRATKGAIAVGGATHAALDLHRAEQ